MLLQFLLHCPIALRRSRSPLSLSSLFSPSCQLFIRTRGSAQKQQHVPRTVQVEESVLLSALFPSVSPLFLFPSILAVFLLPWEPFQSLLSFSLSLSSTLFLSLSPPLLHSPRLGVCFVSEAADQITVGGSLARWQRWRWRRDGGRRYGRRSDFTFPALSSVCFASLPPSPPGAWRQSG